MQLPIWSHRYYVRPYLHQQSEIVASLTLELPIVLTLGRMKEHRLMAFDMPIKPDMNSMLPRRHGIGVETARLVTLFCCLGIP